MPINRYSVVVRKICVESVETHQRQHRDKGTKVDDVSARIKLLKTGKRFIVKVDAV